MGKPNDETDRRLQVLDDQVAALAKDFGKLRRYAPPIAAKRAWQTRIGFEIAGVAIATTGAWWIYPPAALLLVGAWLLADVLAARRTKKGN